MSRRFVWSKFTVLVVSLSGCISVSAWPGLALAQEEGIQVLEPLGQLQEILYEGPSPASGGLVRGAVTGSLDSPVKIEDLRVLLPAGDLLGSSKLCLSVQSIDGSYRGRASYVLPAVSDDIRQFRLWFPTKFATRLSDHAARELVVLAHLNQNCALRPRSIVLASWGEYPGKAATLYVNALGGDARVFIDGEVLSCTESPSRSRRAFHLECQLPSVPAGESSVTVAIYRWDSLEDQETITLFGVGE